VLPAAINPLMAIEAPRGDRRLDDALDPIGEST
jgi:hypothetical protein